MKKPLLILVTLLSMFSCKKNNSDGGTRSTSLQSIIVYNPTASSYRTLNIQSFVYGSDGRLLTYTDKAIDSSLSNGTIGVSYETRIFTFNYSSNVNFPDSYSLTDSDYTSGSNYLMVLHEQNGFVYDAQNRLTADTFNVANSTSSRFAYSGDTVLCWEVIPGSPNSGTFPLLVTENGNVVRNYSTLYMYSSLPNPLQNSTIAVTYQPVFYAGLVGVSTSYGLPVDFISKNLPSSYNDGQGNIAKFNWTTDGKGRVTGGTATNLFPYDNSINGTIYITFNYQ